MFCCCGFAALDDSGNLTSPLGLQMVEFPLSPCFAKMLLVSGQWMQFFLQLESDGNVTFRTNARCITSHLRTAFQFRCM